MLTGEEGASGGELGADAADSTDALNATDAADSVESTDSGADAVDSTSAADSTDTADSSDSVDSGDGEDSGDSQTSSDQVDAADASDVVDGLDSADGIDGVDISDTPPLSPDVVIPATFLRAGVKALVSPESSTPGARKPTRCSIPMATSVRSDADTTSLAEVTATNSSWTVTAEYDPANPMRMHVDELKNRSHR